ncbi:MAG: HAD family phosphatase [Planctomycetota bacterium]
MAAAALPAAVIFDMDGVLVDSYHAHFVSWRETAQHGGVAFDEQTFARTFGKTSRAIIREVWPSGEVLPDEAIRAIDERKEAAYRAIIEREFPAMPGAIGLIDALAALRVPMAVGSSGPAENVAAALRGLERAPAFAATVTGMDVVNGKPDPEVFLLAAERLGVEHESCVVIEDAPHGVEAARRANMGCVAFASTGHERGDFRAHEDDARVRVVDSLDALTIPLLCELTALSG